MYAVSAHDGSVVAARDKEVFNADVKGIHAKHADGPPWVTGGGLCGTICVFCVNPFNICVKCFLRVAANGCLRKIALQTLTSLTAQQNASADKSLAGIEVSA